MLLTVRPTKEEEKMINDLKDSLNVTASTSALLRGGEMCLKLSLENIALSSKYKKAAAKLLRLQGVVESYAATSSAFNKMISDEFDENKLGEK